jgi:hypothetical protein
LCIPYHWSQPRTSHPAPRTASAPQSDPGSTCLPTRYSGFDSDSPDTESGSRGGGRVQRVLLSPPPLLPSTVLDSSCKEFFVLRQRYPPGKFDLFLLLLFSYCCFCSPSYLTSPLMLCICAFKFGDNYYVHRFCASFLIWRAKTVGIANQYPQTNLLLSPSIQYPRQSRASGDVTASLRIPLFVL